jgi:thiol-disulfide isomerase/thioredoxin
VATGPSAVAGGVAVKDEMPAHPEGEASRGGSAVLIEGPAAAGFVLGRRLAKPVLTVKGAAVAREGFVPDGRPSLVALGASWCGPCARELPRLLALFEALPEVRAIMVSLDAVGGPESLRASFEDLFAKAEPSTRPLPTWLEPCAAGAHCEASEIELRADPEGAWLAASAGLLTGRGEPEGLPQLLLLDGRGRLVALLQGELDLAIAGRFERWAEGLAPQVACQEVGP